MGIRPVKILIPFLLFAIIGCSVERESSPNPWLVPFQDRTGSAVSRSQMRAMVRMGNIYLKAGLQREYELCIGTAFDLYPGDIDTTFAYLNILIEKINERRAEVLGKKAELERTGIDVGNLSQENLPENEPVLSLALDYLESQENLEESYENCYRAMAIACDAVPYNADLYYTTANLQFIRGDETGDRDKYIDAINYLKRAISSDSGHIQSYWLIATCYEKLGDTDRAIRFWKLLDVVYNIAPEVMPDFQTDERAALHRDALRYLEMHGAKAVE